MTDSLNNLNNMYVYINCLIHIRNLDRKYTDFRFRHKNMIYSMFKSGCFELPHCTCNEMLQHTYWRSTSGGHFSSNILDTY